MTPIETYIKRLNEQFCAGSATEHSYRPALQSLLEDLLPNLTVTNEPARVSCGAPDFVISKDGAVPVFYIEAKDIDEPLDGRKKHKEQFDRYKESLGNVIFTDYLDFWFYNGLDFKGSTRVAMVQSFKGGEKIVPANGNSDHFISKIQEFANSTHETIITPKQLAHVMAKKARLLASVIEKVIEDESNELYGQFEAFKKTLMRDISHKTFSDLYAQTITYGMFSARLRAQMQNSQNFSRLDAALLIPKTNPFLRKMFQYIAGYDLDERVVWIVDDLADAFRRSDMLKIMDGFGEKTRQNDPIIHFYESFLGEYDPALRKSRGVWYTPQPVVEFIVNAVDEILVHEFALPDGLADTSKVQILDPATGTGTFLAEAVKLIHAKIEKQKNLGGWDSYVEKHLIPRIYGFEILMASYTMAHINLDYLLERTGYKHDKNERLKIYLTNSLEEPLHNIGEIGKMMGMNLWLSDEAIDASEIKGSAPVMVVMGNPPYSAESQNKNDWINSLMDDYKKEHDGRKLQERNSKALNDDYCKFIRLGQLFVSRNKEGILAYINNHGFIDNATFRGMRYNLMRNFDKIYIIDLHGNAKKKEISPDGSKDENVFDIQQGVSINIFVKTSHENDQLAEIYHCDLYGLREYKFEQLAQKLSEIKFTKLSPSAPDYFFVPRTEKNKSEYEKGFAVTELFVKNSIGVVTANDAVLIDFDKKSLLKNVLENYQSADEKFVRKISYKPFDERYIYYDHDLMSRSRWEVMRNFIVGENIGLVAARLNKSPTCDHFYVTKNILETKCGESTIGSYVFPLYIYNGLNGHKGENGCIFDAGCATPSREPNMNHEIIKKIEHQIKMKFEKEKSDDKKFSPIDIFDYIYAILHSPSYREKFKEFLKINFPRVPYPHSQEFFAKMVSFGGNLRKLHLFEGDFKHVASFPEKGDNKVLKWEFVNEKIFINEKQYFEGANEAAWNFFVGGYKPLQKWLKDRKDKILAFDDIAHYEKMVSVIIDTIALMGEIEEFFTN